MPRAATKLKPVRGELSPSAKVIDAHFTVVGKKRGFVQRLLGYVLIVACVAVAGFLIPPAAILAVELFRK